MALEEFDGEEMNPEALEQLSGLSDDQPFALINLLRYKEWAEYPPGTVTEKISGREAYERYAELSTPPVVKVGGVPMWRGDATLTFIGPPDEQWDEILIMQYPTVRAFRDMIADPEFQAIVIHRTAAVQDSRLYGATSPQAIGPLKWRLFNLSQKLRGD